MKKMTFASLLLAVMLTACTKDKDEPAQSAKDLLVSGTWKTPVYGEDWNGNDKPDAGEYYPNDACENDDTYQFVSGGSLVVSNGALKCDPADPSSETFSWLLANNDTELVISYPSFGMSINWKILTLNKTEVVLMGNVFGSTTFLKMSR